MAKRKARTILALAILVGGATGAPGAPAVRLVDEHRLELELRPLTARAAPRAGRTPLKLEVDPASGGELAFELRWPGAEAVSQLRLRAVERPSPSRLDHHVLVDAELTLPDGSTRRASRGLSFDDSATELFEIARAGAEPLTLAIEARCTRVPRLVAGAEAGRPVVLKLEIQHLAQDSAVSLETNHLSTFVGEPVSYSFRLGEAGDGASIRLQLTPLRLFDDLAQIEIEVSGALPDGDRLTVIGRTEQWVTSRGATSSLTVGSGEPVVGYRFLVTPDF